MIFDKVENIALYKGMHPKLDIAIEDILSRDLASCPCGERIDVSGGVFFSVADVALKERAESRWECHDEYIDLQYVLSGDAETIEYGYRGDISPWDKNPNGDIYFSEDDKLRLPVSLEAGFFAVFFPQDAHRPAQGEKGRQSRKVVYKIPVE